VYISYGNFAVDTLTKPFIDFGKKLPGKWYCLLFVNLLSKGKPVREEKRIECGQQEIICQNFNAL